MIILTVAAFICAVLGIIGSVVPGLPGPPLAWVGLLLAWLAGLAVSSTVLWAFLAVTVVVTVIDYLVPGWLTRSTGGHKEASLGAIIGLFAGMFIPPLGILVGALFGAFIGELIFAGQDAMHSVKAALGAFLGFLIGTGAKLVVSGLIFFLILRSCFG